MAHDYTKVTPAQAKAIVDALKGRKKKLEDQLGALDLATADLEEAERLEREIEVLEPELQRRKDELEMVDKATQGLETIEKAVAGSGEEFSKRRALAEDVYDAVVKRIMRDDGCDESTAHARAANDPAGRQAYAVVIEMQERECAACDGAARIGAYVE